MQASKLWAGLELTGTGLGRKILYPGARTAWVRQVAGSNLVDH